MIALLADHNLIGQSALIWSVFSPADWQALGVAALHQFSEVGLPFTATDRDVWQTCQARGCLLVTANRNADGDDSLARVIAELNHPAALPVLTIANANRVVEWDYREDCAYRIADIATRIEQFYGTERLFVP